MRIPDSVIEEVSRRTDIVELVSNYITLKKSGSRYMGLCPFHSEKTPSFSVNPEIGAYYCFGCNRGGSVYNFIMDIEGLTFPEAVKTLAERAGVEFSTESDDEGDNKRRGLLELYSRVAKTFTFFLTEHEMGAAAREILESRGLTEDSLAMFGLGFSPADPYWLHAFLVKKGYSLDFLGNSGLFTRANERRSLFSGRIMFPIQNRRGETIAFGGRIVDGDGPKYINSPETDVFRKSEELYGLNHAVKSMRTKRKAIVCEGYTDVIAFHQAGMPNAVAPLGTALTELHTQKLAKACSEIVLVFDGDAAGVRAATRAILTIEKTGMVPWVALLEAGKDPADIVREMGSHALRDAISSPISPIEFLVRTASTEDGQSKVGDKAFVLDTIFPYISVMRSEVKRRESLRLAADLVGTDPGAVDKDYERYRRGKPAPRKGESSKTGTFSGDHGGDFKASSRHKESTSYDQFLLLATVANREEFGYVRQWIHLEDLEDDVAKDIYVALEEAYRRDESTLGGLLQRLEDPESKDLVQRRMASGEFAGVGSEAIKDGVVAVRQRSLHRQIKAVEQRLRLAGRSASAQDERELLGEKMYLDRELQKLKGEGR